MIYLRPHLHFTPPADWMNDPNGLVYHKGLWHLFYQGQPAGQMEKRWGHAASADLFTWQNLPDALLPDELGAIWSGSAVCDTDNTSGFFPDAPDGDGGLVAIFTHHKAIPSSEQSQSQSLAYSHDDGQTWTKYEHNPVLTHPSPDFRDPKVFWHTPTRAWVMIVSAGHLVEIYRSPDLKNWTLASAWGANRMPGTVWECPDLFPLPDENGVQKWVLLSSFLGMDNFKGRFASCFAAYFAGTFDGYRFSADNEEDARRIDFGPDNYAPVTFAHAPGNRCVLVGWLNHWGYAGNLDTRPWQGQMTAPRELNWRNNALVQAPPPEWQEAVVLSRLTLAPGEPPVMATPTRAPLEITVPQTAPASWRVEARQNGALLWTLARDMERSIWEFARGPASLPPLKNNPKLDTQKAWTSPHMAPVRGANGDVRLLLDAYSVEAFCDDGETIFSAQIFPPAPDLWEIVWEVLEKGN